MNVADGAEKGDLREAAAVEIRNVDLKRLDEQV